MDATYNLPGAPVLVVGAGIMGLGIAQVAAQAGHTVMLHDTRNGAALQARDRLAEMLGALVAKGRMSDSAAAQTQARVQPIASLDAAGNVRLVIEAIVERLDDKRGLFKQLETIVSPHCILATNTSSISVTAMASGLQHPGRLVGMHFFNPVPLMKLVEVVSGLQTDAAAAAAVYALSTIWGKRPVHARSTPGFVVNRIARPFYAEALGLLQERACTPEVIDQCLRAVGFRMGPCELMDLIGHDTNFAVTQSVFEANFFDKRYTPSLLQREMVDGGLLGRKSGRGFYDHAHAGARPPPASAPPAQPREPQELRLHGQGPMADHFAASLLQAGHRIDRVAGSDWMGLEVPSGALRLTDGRTASETGVEVAVFDLAFTLAPGAALAWAPSLRASAAWVQEAEQWLHALGLQPLRVADVPGLVVARTLAMLINEASDAVHQGVCTVDGADAAMKLGVNYPAGPFEWLANWNPQAVIALLDALDAYYRGERYRVSPWLRQRAWR